KFIARELPRKGLRMLVAQVLVKCESHANGIQVGKVVWREHLALDDRKVDLDLVEPTGMNRSMDQDDARINFPQAVAGRFATMRRPVIHNPEQSFRRTVGLLRENLIHQSAKRFDATRWFATSQDITTPNIPRCQILQCSATLILEFDPCCAARARSQRRMDSDTGLNARLLISTEDKITVFQGFSAPIPRVQVEDRSGLFQELRVSRKDPVFVLPRLYCVFVQDPPYGAGAHDIAQRPSHSRGKIVQGLPANRFASFRDALTSQGLDQCVIPRGKKWPYSRVRFHPPGKSFPPPSVSANDGPVGPIDPHGGQVAPGSSRGVKGRAVPTGMFDRNNKLRLSAYLCPGLFQKPIGEGRAINRIGASHDNCPLPGPTAVSLPGTDLYRIIANP